MAYSKLFYALYCLLANWVTFADLSLGNKVKQSDLKWPQVWTLTCGKIAYNFVHKPTIKSTTIQNCVLLVNLTNDSKATTITSYITLSLRSLYFANKPGKRAKNQGLIKHSPTPTHCRLRPAHCFVHSSSTISESHPSTVHVIACVDPHLNQHRIRRLATTESSNFGLVQFDRYKQRFNQGWLIYRAYTYKEFEIKCKLRIWAYNK